MIGGLLETCDFFRRLALSAPLLSGKIGRAYTQDVQSN
jgi:hypothetical protein